MLAIKYLCIKCHSSVAIKSFGQVDPNSKAPRVRCPFCKHVCAPEKWLEIQYENKATEFDWRGFYRNWSNCPNAYKCSLHDQYDQDCEDGRLMQKCLVSIHGEVEYAVHFSQQVAQQAPKNPRRKKQDIGDC